MIYVDPKKPLQSSKAKQRLRSCEWATRKVAWWQPVGILRAMGYEPSILLGKDTGVSSMKLDAKE